MKKLVLLIFILQSFMSCAQEDNDRVNIERINSFIEENLSINSSKHAIFFLKDKYIVVTQLNDSLTINYLSEKLGFEGSSRYTGEILEVLFTSEFLNPPFYNYMDNEYKDSCIGSLMYFSIFDGNKLASEFLLPSILLCDEKKVEYPISDIILREFYNLIESHW